MTSARFIPSPCPFCKIAAPAATHASGDGRIAPPPGAIALCVSCAEVSIFDDDLILRAPTDDELVEIYTGEAGPFIKRDQFLIRYNQKLQRKEGKQDGTPSNNAD